MSGLVHLPWERPRSFDLRPCVADETTDLTYAQFAVRVDAASEHLAEHGVTAGSVVAVMLPNRVELLVAMAAAWRLGAAATPINPALTASEAEYQIRDSDAVVVVNSDQAAPNAGRPAIGADLLRREARGRIALPAPATRTASAALLIYTSGSIGRPKGVILTHANLAAMTQMMSSGLGITRADHCLLVLPLFHVNAICISFLSTTSVGGRLSVLTRFHPTQFLERVQALRPTFFSGVPTIYAHIVTAAAAHQSDFTSLRMAFCGGAPASKELLETAERTLGCPLVEGYGLTEGTCASTANPVDGPRKIGTVGVALTGQTVAILGQDGGLVSVGERGEVVIQGPNVMQGYLNQPEATAEALGDGWLHTGDVGILDEDGYLRIADRIKDLIIRGGENIYPKEIETVLHSHAGVMEAAVVGEPHQLFGEGKLATAREGA